MQQIDQRPSSEGARVSGGYTVSGRDFKAGDQTTQGGEKKNQDSLKKTVEGIKQLRGLLKNLGIPKSIFIGLFMVLIGLYLSWIVKKGSNDQSIHKMYQHHIDSLSRSNAAQIRDLNLEVARLNYRHERDSIKLLRTVDTKREQRQVFEQKAYETRIMSASDAALIDEYMSDSIRAIGTTVIK